MAFVIAMSFTLKRVATTVSALILPAPVTESSGLLKGGADQDAGTSTEVTLLIPGVNVPIVPFVLVMAIGTIKWRGECIYLSTNISSFSGTAFHELGHAAAAIANGQIVSEFGGITLALFPVAAYVGLEDLETMPLYFYLFICFPFEYRI